MKILSARQSQQADQYTIKHEPISSIDLMERAVEGLFAKISRHFKPPKAFEIYCGKGNNGGDGLGLARLLARNGYPVRVVVLEHSSNASEDFNTNLKRLKDTDAKLIHLYTVDEWEEPAPDTLVVDAVLGAGLSRPLEGFISEVISVLNASEHFKIAIDIPTGLFADDNSENDLSGVFRADWTLSMQQPKLSMYHKDTAPWVGKISVVPIGLHPNFLEKAETRYFSLEKEDVKKLFKPRQKHSYKGTYGHALLLAGSRGSMGAAVLSGRAALRSGAGLLTAAVPGCGLVPMQVALPEAMVLDDKQENYLAQLPDFPKATAIAAGPGMGTNAETAKLVKLLIQTAGAPLIFDADALNHIAENKTWLSFLPPHTILTPHIGEFKRLLGVENLGPEYLDQLREFSMQYKLTVVLKDSITAIAEPGGRVYFVDEGSPALASPGSGDVLTGVILGLLSWGYAPLHAAMLGVYLQGRAGRLAGERFSLEATLARDVVTALGKAFRELDERPSLVK